MGGNSYESSPRRGRSHHRTRRSTSVSGDRDDSASPSKHKKRSHSHSIKQNVPIPRIHIQAPTPPLSASSSSHYEIRRNEQSRRIRHSQARETLRSTNDGDKDAKDDDKGKGKSTSKDRDGDNSKGRTGRCTHVHHHHYHVHNHYHKYYIHNDKQVGEPTHDVKHSIYGQPPFDQSDPQAAMKYQEEHHRKHTEQHRDREQQSKQEQKQSQPSHHRRDSNGVNNPGPSQQRPHRLTRSRSTTAQLPEPEYPPHPPSGFDFDFGAVAAEPAEEWKFPKSFTSSAIYTYPHHTSSIQQDVRNTMDQADAYSATALVNADEEASAIVQANSPRSWTSSPSSGRNSVSTLTSISRGVVYNNRRGGRRESYESGSDSGSVQRRKSKKGGFRAWVSRHLRD
ncbi:hypothetical protein F5Y00DRAFT_134491 [Daldinia vernicosa]|uniref:uncharacterized protein n=1 Tax=Daldinia vernicosa TaxID=114800 RepID=UPI0020086C07|nr:uncharacterized protein F5Y00DRAFT_134491 [Daldinia vernicosa]KAI0853191.1 hypothetical protein F5Y00DRAFT_134491 [Daldinia vernicosa]